MQHFNISHLNPCLLIARTRYIQEISFWSTSYCSCFSNLTLPCVSMSDDGAVDGEIRLIGGSSPASGRVEIFYRGEWGTVCEDGWTTANARVTCLELGFTSVAKVQQSFGPGKGRVWMDRVSCSGSETALATCRHRGWGVNSCQHSEDVGVICSGGLISGL